MTILKLNNPFIGGIIIAALMSAVMSSADSILNSGTAVVVKDFYEEYLKKKQGREMRLVYVRLTTIILGVLGFMLAAFIPDVIDLLLFTYSVWAPSILVPVLFGVFTKQKSWHVYRLIIFTMMVSALATLLFTLTEYAEHLQPTVFGVGIAVVVFLSGYFFLPVSKKIGQLI
jgi:SSS family solute:Na+ symporter